VSTGVPIIDLDVAPSRADAEARPLRLRVSAPRPILLLAVLVTALAALSAAAAPPPRLTHVLSAGGTAAAAFTLGTDSLYTAQFGNNPNSESAVRRFALTNGEVRWAAALPQNVQNLVIDDQAHVLMARSGADPKISFLDADTGEVLWHDESADTSVITMARGTVLIRTAVGGKGALVLADARSGRRIWVRIVDPTVTLGPEDLYSSAPTRITALTADGKLTLFRYADGAVLSEGDLHVRVGEELGANLQANFVGVRVIGDRVYVSRRDSGKASLTAYSIAPLTQLWRTEGGPVGSVEDCLAVLCVTDTRWVSGVDPDGGAVRWTDPAWSSASPYDATRLFAYDQQEQPETVLLDAATGKVTRRLGHSVQLGAALLRSDDVIPGVAWVSITDPADGAIHTVGRVETAAAYGCDQRGVYLACPTIAGPTTVWRLPRL
jgi:outer membrane protein assembly factor BamB